jgi:hypothetical protein
MTNLLRTVKRTVGNLEMYRRFREVRELNSYRFQTSSLTPTTSLELVDYGLNTRHKILINTGVDELQKQIAVIKKLRYSKPNRSTWALIQGCIALGKVETLLKKNALDVLCIGCGADDTYVPQLLARNGLAVSLVNLDVADYASHRSWSSFSKRGDAIYVQGDARELATIFPDKRFDIILMSRGSIDLMPLAEFFSIWEQAFQILAAPGIIIGSVKGLELTPVNIALLAEIEQQGKSTIQSHMATYSSAIGEFRLSGNAAPWYLPDGGSFSGTDLLSLLNDDVSQVSAITSLTAVNDGPDKESAGRQFLEAASVYYDRYHDRLNIFELPGPPQTESVDWIVSPKGNGAFSMRSSLVTTKSIEGAIA